MINEWKNDYREHNVGKTGVFCPTPRKHFLQSNLHFIYKTSAAVRSIPSVSKIIGPKARKYAHYPASFAANYANWKNEIVTRNDSHHDAINASNSVVFHPYVIYQASLETSPKRVSDLDLIKLARHFSTSYLANSNART